MMFGPCSPSRQLGVTNGGRCGHCRCLLFDSKAVVQDAQASSGSALGFTVGDPGSLAIGLELLARNQVTEREVTVLLADFATV
jgi:hypothetical protein